MNGDVRPIRLSMVCTGLGNVDRGYESFTRECFDMLKDETTIDSTLYKGGGESRDREVVLWNLPRGGTAAKCLKKLGVDPYHVEQATFFLQLIKHLKREQPDVVFFTDRQLGRLLQFWRNRTGLKFRLLFHNGVPATPPYPYWEHVHELTPGQLRAAVAAGESLDKLSFVPLGRNIEQNWTAVDCSAKRTVREDLQLPVDRKIILSVAAFNTAHKRIDYLIREIAQMGDDRPYLLMLGHREREAQMLQDMAVELLGEDGFKMMSVPYEHMPAYYKAADLFVLTSLTEGFGLVMVEAQSCGLLCLVHDYETAHYVIGAEGMFADFKVEGGLSSLVSRALKVENSSEAQQSRHDSAYNRFSWEKLQPQYVEMITKCARK